MARRNQDETSMIIPTERVRELLDALIHAVRYSDRNPADGYAKDEVMIARRLVIDELTRRDARIKQLESGIIKIASDLACNKGLERLFPDTHPKPAMRAYWFELLETAGDVCKDYAVKLRALLATTHNPS